MPTVYADSIFFPEGLETVEAPLVHYLHIGCWATRTADYYRHRRPKNGEPRDLLHFPVFLHRAHPRDRFVFLVMPVAGGMPVMTVWDRVMKAAYGVAPRFAIRGRAQTAHRVGVEAIEALQGQQDNLVDRVTALDAGGASTCGGSTMA